MTSEKDNSASFLKWWLEALHCEYEIRRSQDVMLSLCLTLDRCEIKRIEIDRLGAKTRPSHAVAVESEASSSSFIDMEVNLLEKVRSVEIEVAKVESSFKAPQGSSYQVNIDLPAPYVEVCELSWKDPVRRKQRSLGPHLGARNDFQESLEGVESIMKTNFRKTGRRNL